MQRRTFLASARPARDARIAGAEKLDLTAAERTRVLKAASKYPCEAPVTVTAASSPRSAGGKHDFFSEGDYWLPDPAKQERPYIQRHGMTNPDSFVEHRRAMIRFSLAGAP
jgi:hypothetical protein